MFKFLKNFRRKEASTMDVSVLINLLEKQQAEQLLSYEAASERGYKCNGVVFRSITLIGRGVGSVPLKLVKQQGKEVVEQPPDHPFLWLMENPNPKDLTRSQYMHRICIHLYLGGEVGLWKARSLTPPPEGSTAKAKPVALWAMHASQFKLVDPNKPQVGYHYGGNRSFIYPFEDVRFLRFINPTDDKTGFSPVNAASLSIIQANNSRTWNNGMLNNGCRPPGILTSKIPIDDPEERKRLLETFSAKYAGPNNAGTPFLGGEIEFQPTGYNPTEMDWLKGQQGADRTTAFTIGVPSQLLGDKDAATYSNMETAHRAVYEDEIVPVANWIYAQHTAWLAPDFEEGLVIVPNWDKVAALQENRTEAWTRVRDSDCLTISEKRKELGFDEIKGAGGDLILTQRGVVITKDGKYFIPATLIEVGADGKPVEEPEPEPKPKPAKPEEEEGEEDDEGEAAAPDVLEYAESPWALETEKQKTDYWKAFNRRREPYVRIARRLFSMQFNAERRAVVSAVKRLAHVAMIPAAVETVLAGQEAAWLDTYLKVYLVTGLVFFRDVFRSLPKSVYVPFRVKLLKVDEDGIEDLWAASVTEHLTTIAGSKIKGIAKTTLERVRKALAEGEALGEGITQLSARLDQLYLKEIIPNRSEVIARTETCNSSNMASHEAAKATGVAKRKIWISTRDERAREDHWNPATNGADDQKVAMDDPFVVGGAQLMWPGDTSLGAPADQVINCRCTVGFETSI